MSWLRGILDVFVPHTPSVKFDPVPHIRHAVMASGLTKERPEDLDFYISAYESKRLNPRDVRKFGTLLGNEEKEALGVPAQAILAHEFIATLNDKGLADPGAAARNIAQPAAQRCRSAVTLLKLQEAGVERASFHAPAGSCHQAAALDGARMPAGKAKLLPIEECDRPDRCECHYQAAYDSAGDMDDVLI